MRPDRSAEPILERSLSNLLYPFIDSASLCSWGGGTNSALRAERDQHVADFDDAVDAMGEGVVWATDEGDEVARSVDEGEHVRTREATCVPGEGERAASGEERFPDGERIGDEGLHIGVVLDAVG